MQDEPTVLVEVYKPSKSGASDMAHYLAVLEGPRKGRWIEVPDEPTVIGRSSEADLNLGDRTVSGRHCRLRMAGDRLIVQDLGSMNGTFINARKVTQPSELPLGASLQVGSSLLKHEYRSRTDVREQEALRAELDKAAAYVRSLLPKPLTGNGLTTEWRFIPCAKLGGDAFGYHWLDDDRFAIYLLDACGHGTRSALHSVSVINLLSKQTLPEVDFGHPDEVLTALNSKFRMEDHSGMYFTIFYGIYHASERRLVFSAAGHPPAVLVGNNGTPPSELHSKRPAIGLFEGIEYEAQDVSIPPDSRLYLFSDGAYEITTRDGRDWTLEEFLELLTDSEAPTKRVRKPEDEPKRIEKAVRKRMRGDFEDDFSVLVAGFR